MSEPERCTDEQLKAIAQYDPSPITRSAAAELLGLRSIRRRDSRRAEQLKRLRWVVENMLTKIESLSAKWDTETMGEVDEQPETEKPQ